MTLWLSTNCTLSQKIETGKNEIRHESSEEGERIVGKIVFAFGQAEAKCSRWFSLVDHYPVLQCVSCGCVDTWKKCSCFSVSFSIGQHFILVVGSHSFMHQQKANKIL